MDRATYTCKEFDFKQVMHEIRKRILEAKNGHLTLILSIIVQGIGSGPMLKLTW